MRSRSSFWRILWASVGPLLPPLGFAGCGAENTPTTSSGRADVQNWTLSGVVTTNGSGAPVAGAVVTVDGIAPVTTDSTGAFAVSSSGPDARRVRITAAEYLPRETWINGGTSRSGAKVDLIADRPPFDLAFYREFARGRSPSGIETIKPWTTAPSFYLKTTDQQGRPVDAELIAKVEAAIRYAVPQWTGGRFAVATVARGSEARSDRMPGWVNVYFHVDDPQERGYGRATTGSLSLDKYIHFPVVDRTTAKCKGESLPGIAWSTIVHEVGHVMGYEHPQIGGETMMAPGAALYQCRMEDVSEIEQFHAAVTYSRPPGNRDPDVDPDTFRAAVATPTAEIICN